ncbi:WD40-repeat-containing domain protein [Gorgonomyces haynaldii]|nr:WD40-repeat-containing domain protein [Gorgonomyces haynaldii]
MISRELGEYGPQIGTSDDNFFQSDRDLLKQQERNKKKQEFGQQGSPIDCGAKVLHFLIQNDHIFVGLSNFMCLKMDLTGNIIAQFKGHKGPVTFVHLDKDLYTCSWDKTVKRWNPETGDLIKTYVGHSDFVKSLVLANGRLYTSSVDKSIGIWDLESAKLIKTLQGHRRSVESVQFDGEYLYSGSSDNTIKQWHIKEEREVQVFSGHDTSIYKILLDREQECIWSVSADKTCRRLDLTTSKFDLKFVHPDYVKSVILLPNGHIATGCRDENIRIWDPTTEKCLKVIRGHFGEIEHLTIHGAVLWSGSLDGTLRSWNLLDPQLGEAPVEEEVVEESLMTEEEERELAELMGL